MLACGWEGASLESGTISVVHFSILFAMYSSSKFDVPIAAPIGVYAHVLLFGLEQLFASPR